MRELVSSQTDTNNKQQPQKQQLAAELMMHCIRSRKLCSSFWKNEHAAVSDVQVDISILAFLYVGSDGQRMTRNLTPLWTPG